MLKKYATFEILEVLSRDNVIFKDMEEDLFEIPEKDGMVYARVRAIASKINNNFDGFERSELEKSYKTFVGKPIFVEHNNSSPEFARGIIIDAAYHDDQPDAWIELLLEVDGEAYPLLAEGLKKGRISKVSMGTNVAYSVCSVCGNEARSEKEYCSHIKNKGRTYKNSEGRDVLAYEINRGLEFFEISFVISPAEEWADVLAVYGEQEEFKLKKVASNIRKPKESVNCWNERTGHNAMRKVAQQRVPGKKFASTGFAVISLYGGLPMDAGVFSDEKSAREAYQNAINNADNQYDIQLYAGSFGSMNAELVERWFGEDDYEYETESSKEDEMRKKAKVETVHIDEVITPKLAQVTDVVETDLPDVEQKTQEEAESQAQQEKTEEQKKLEIAFKDLSDDGRQKVLDYFGIEDLEEIRFSLSSNKSINKKAQEDIDDLAEDLEYGEAEPSDPEYEKKYKKVVEVKGEPTAWIYGNDTLCDQCAYDWADKFSGSPYDDGATPQWGSGKCDSCRRSYGPAKSKKTKKKAQQLRNDEDEESIPAAPDTVETPDGDEVDRKDLEPLEKKEEKTLDTFLERLQGLIDDFKGNKEEEDEEELPLPEEEEEIPPEEPAPIAPEEKIETAASEERTFTRNVLAKRLVRELISRGALNSEDELEKEAEYAKLDEEQLNTRLEILDTLPTEEKEAKASTKKIVKKSVPLLKKSLAMDRQPISTKEEDVNVSNLFI